MKIFTKLLILKWHYIEHEFIKLGNINFLTGKNASGKSTLIDAMQVVLLGDTSGHFFNKSANKKSRRTLISYVKGELTDNDEAGFKYIRNDDFTSIIAMEVYDDVKHKNFIIGIQIDVATDNSMDKSFFIMDGCIPNNHFINDGMVMNIRELKDYADRNNIRLDQYKQNDRYKEALLGKLGNINHKYFSLFKKAVPFTPITDIKGFITEFICDTDKKVDIRNMQNNIRYYERMKLEAEDVEKRVIALTQIQYIYNEYTRLKDLEKLQRYIVDKGREQLAYERVKNIEVNIKKLDKSIIAQRENYERNKRILEALEDERIAIDRELINSEEYNRAEEYKKTIKALKTKIKTNEETRDRILGKLNQRIGSWNHQFKKPDKDKNNEDLSSLLLELEDISSFLNEHNLGNIDYDTLYLINQEMEQQLQLHNQQLFTLQNNIKNKTIKKNDLMVDIKGLEQGKKSVEKRVEKLKQLLITELSKIHNKQIEVSLICDLIEIKNAKWQNAIEGYLHLQKFYLYIEPEYFIDGLKIYERYKEEHNIFDVGLIDIGKVNEKTRLYMPGSLAEEIDTDNRNVRQYINYLLGRVMKVEDVSQLRNHIISITPTCMLYKNYVARQINPKRYEVPYIGVGAIMRQLEVKRQMLEVIKKELEELNEKEIGFKAICKLRAIGEDIIEEFNRSKNEINHILSDKTILDQWQQKLSEIDNSNIITLKFKLQDIGNQIKIKRDDISNQGVDIRVNEEKVEKLRSQDILNAEADMNKFLSYIKASYDSNWVMNTGQPRFMQEINRLHTCEKVVSNFQQSQKGTESQRKGQWDKLLETRGVYIREFQGTYSINDESNKAYDNLLIQLSQTELPNYKARIDDAIKIAQQEFKDDFLSKLKYNIDVVMNQINELNTALKSRSFGKDSYAFKITPNSQYKKYYDMITDPNLMGDFTIFTQVFQDKYRDVMDELFKKIIDVGEGALTADERAEIELNIKKYTDYRTYLDFDLVVTDVTGRKSHLSKMITKKSGGETQTPFYISVLASFYRVYRMNAKNKDTSRLIIFDEAFSKMDHERISVCIKLLKELGFQALISAPTEKIANIAPLVDKTLGVIRTVDGTFVKSFTKEELDDVI